MMDIKTNDPHNLYTVFWWRKPEHPEDITHDLRQVYWMKLFSHIRPLPLVYNGHLNTTWAAHNRWTSTNGPHNLYTDGHLQTVHTTSTDGHLQTAHTTYIQMDIYKRSTQLIQMDIYKRSTQLLQMDIYKRSTQLLHLQMDIYTRSTQLIYRWTSTNGPHNFYRWTSTNHYSSTKYPLEVH